MRNVKSGHKVPVVCLDAGHYGQYNRSPVVKDYYESNMVWKLHNYLATELETYGVKVKKTRTSQEKDMELTARGKASKGADLFISLHSNACGTESVDRPVGIYLLDDDCGAIDEQSRQVAVLLAETVQRVMQTKGKAQTYSRKATKDRDRDGKKNDDYYGVLFGAHQAGTAGIILEHSFHTNTRAAKWLLIDANLQELAKAEAAAIAYWFDLDEEPDAETSTEAQDKPQSVKKLYRIRKTWDNAASQLGAYSVLENAVKACPAGYSVFDWNGTTVHTEAAGRVTVAAAKSGPDKAKAGTYKVKSSSGLNLRAGAATGKTIIKNMANGSLVKCYGFYTGDWYYVKTSDGAVGFCHSSYLVKV